MKKILALVMVLAMMCGMLVSCDNATTLIEKADAALLEAPYSMTMKMNFECDNEDINKILSVMNVEVPVIVDGNNMSMDMSMDMMGHKVEADIIVADKVMYYDMSMMGQNMKMKCTLTDEQYEQFKVDNNTEMPVDPTDFVKVSVENKDGKKYIACGEVTEEGLKAINDMLKSAFEAVKGEAEAKNVTCGITLNDGKYESMNMTCEYAVTVAGETYNLTFTLDAEFKYGDFAKITTPADASSYQEVSYSDLVG